MADLEARREARRLKILRNSENRMNRLLGKPTVSDEGSSSTTSVSSSDAPGQNPLPERRDLSEGSTASTDRMIPSGVGETTRTADGDTSAPAPESEILRGGVRQRPHRTRLAETDSETDQSSPVQSASYAAKSATSTRNGLVDSHAKSESPPGQIDPLKLLDLMRCGGCLLAAFLTRWALRFGLGLLFLECAMIPFFVMEGSLLYFQTTHMKDLQLPHKSSMITYALVLSGLRQELIMKYTTIMGYVSAVTEDFALFLFAFLVCNAVIV